MGPEAVVLLLHHMPQKITLGDGSHIISVPGEHREGGIAVLPEFFQSLPDGIVIVKVGHQRLGCQQRGYIHIKTPFAAVILWVNYTTPFCENHQRTVN